MYLLSVPEAGASSPSVTGVGTGIGFHLFQPVTFFLQAQGSGCVYPYLIVTRGSFDHHSSRFPCTVIKLVLTAQ